MFDASIALCYHHIIKRASILATPMTNTANQNNNQRYFDYLDQLRGVPIYSAPCYLIKEFGLTRESASEIVSEWARTSYSPKKGAA